MKVLFAASEVHPLAKTGGLADVAAALPRALKANGVDVRVCLPLYPRVRRQMGNVELVAKNIACPFAGGNRPFNLLLGTLKGDVPVFLVENSGMFEVEESFYGVQPGSYGDAHLRFAYFARALLRIPAAAGFHPDILHLNDWQTALAALLVRSAAEKTGPAAKAATVLTIHNLAYQGVFAPADLRQAGIPSALLSEGILLVRGQANLLAAGLRAADIITTVSHTYAEEILTEEYGNGLEGLLRARRNDLVGIINGLDTLTWDPATDPHLPAHFNSADRTGKAQCKSALLEGAGLEPTNGPLFGVVSRLAEQKGLDLALAAMDRILSETTDVRLVVLGSGENRLEAGFKALEQHYPRRVSVRLAFDPAYASLVEAGSDLFLMPSRFEPCGLNQLISMRYGTVPIVRRTGGLQDTVCDTDAASLRAGTATGFCFTDPTPTALYLRIRDALEVFHAPETFQQLINTGMGTDWSWNRAARRYADIYTAAIEQRTRGAASRWIKSVLPPDPIEVELPVLPLIPAGYAHDVLSVQPRDPHTLVVSWELSEVGNDHGPRMVLIELQELECGGMERRSIEAGTRQSFFSTRPDTRYRARLLDSKGAEILMSPVVRTPRQRRSH
ncbi:MAG: glycogen synthase GlgA [Planctomycetes bacterium]|nr:glycogen synthase GlgA [Planctomycetota bacterium]